MDAPALADLSPEEKRALLADLLRRKAAANSRNGADNGNGHVPAVAAIPPLTPARDAAGSRPWATT